jgi:hypothetical protein
MAVLAKGGVLVVTQLDRLRALAIPSSCCARLPEKRPVSDPFQNLHRSDQKAQSDHLLLDVTTSERPV